MYKILSLDGGGSWALIQLLTLKDRYGNLSGHEILKKYDLVIANSGGSIVLAALAENYSLDEAMDLFQVKANRESIFYKNSFKDRYFPIDYLRALGIPFGPKYSSKKKKEAFINLFPNIHEVQMTEIPAKIGKESLKIVVCTYDALNNRAKFFKSYGANKKEFDSIKLTEAINGSSNAPVQYFDFPVRFKAKKSDIFFELWDGALGGFNNPVLAGIIEAFKLGIDFKDIRVVSLGTSNSLMSADTKKKFWERKQTAVRFRRKKWALGKLTSQFNFFKDTVLNQAKTILYQPPDTANYIAMMFLKATTGRDSQDNILRLSPLIHYDNGTALEIIPLIQQLYSLDMDLTEDKDIKALHDCFKAWKAGHIYNQPLEFKVERDNDVVALEGYLQYQEGMDRWIGWDNY
ncbi:patatin-like phospholipase family protein [Flavimarina sp. Hel_I_48]|uniref:patatin-like phospholipase family protein n=1 Tax=Flavimarina sp. Hel_I_48 TaxID=1392488 RepID=UPI0004DF021B|nr:patatin-like phospholipase family protein [Flavimarina sp. Hel_I_48]